MKISVAPEKDMHMEFPSVAQMRWPEWSVWHCPLLGEPYLQGASVDSTKGLAAVRLSYHGFEEPRQAILESSGRAVSGRLLNWYVRQLDAAADVEGLDSVFSAPPRDLDVSWDKEREVRADLEGQPALGQFREWNNSSVTTFESPGSFLMLLRRNYPLDKNILEFVRLDNLSAAEAKRREVIAELTQKYSG